MNFTLVKSPKIERILKEHKLRVTERRIDVLQHFFREGKALSHKDLEHLCKEMDRVTLYRTLQSFMDNGLVHKIPTESGNTMYGLCNESCHPDQHQHDHIHFTCEKCGKVECLDEQLPAIKIPGYVVEDISLMLKGICKDCREN